jgi:hypothetical protein
MRKKILDKIHNYDTEVSEKTKMVDLCEELTSKGSE